MQSLQAAFKESEQLIHCAKRTSVLSNRNSSINGSDSFSILQKLAKLRDEEIRTNKLLFSQKANNKNCVTSSPRLLEILIEREDPERLFIGLHSDGISLSTSDKKLNNTMNNSKIIGALPAKISYENERILQYIECGHIPPFLTNVIENYCSRLYYAGCIIAEIRDYRVEEHVVHYVLLRPSNESILYDVDGLGPDWTVDEKLKLESLLVLVNSGPLCLDPKPSLSLALQNVQNDKLNLKGNFRIVDQFEDKRSLYTKYDESDIKDEDTIIEELYKPKKEPIRDNVYECIQQAKMTRKPIERFFDYPDATIQTSKRKLNSNEVLEYLKKRKLNTPSNEEWNNTTTQDVPVEEYVIQAKKDKKIGLTTKFSLFATPLQGQIETQMRFELKNNKNVVHPVIKFKKCSLTQALSTISSFGNILTLSNSCDIAVTHAKLGKIINSFVTKKVVIENNTRLIGSHEWSSHCHNTLISPKMIINPSSATSLDNLHYLYKLFKSNYVTDNDNNSSINNNNDKSDDGEFKTFINKVFPHRSTYQKYAEQQRMQNHFQEVLNEQRKYFKTHYSTSNLKMSNSYLRFLKLEQFQLQHKHRLQQQAMLLEQKVKDKPTKQQLEEMFKCPRNVQEISYKEPYKEVMPALPNGLRKNLISPTLTTNYAIMQGGNCEMPYNLLTDLKNNELNSVNVSIKSESPSFLVTSINNNPMMAFNTSLSNEEIVYSSNSQSDAQILPNNMLPPNIKPQILNSNSGILSPNIQTPLSNIQIQPTNIPLSNTQISSDVLSSNIQIPSSNIPISSDMFSSDIFSSNIQIPSPNIQKSIEVLSSDLFSSSNIQMSSDIISSDVQIPSSNIQNPSPNIQMLSDLLSSNIQILSNVFPSSSQMPSDMLSSNVQIPSSNIQNPSSNIQMSSDVLSSNIQLSSNVLPSSSQMSLDLLSSNVQIPSSNQITSNVFPSNSQISSDLLSSNIQIPSPNIQILSSNIQLSSPSSNNLHLGNNLTPNINNELSSNFPFSSHVNSNNAVSPSTSQMFRSRISPNCHILSSNDPTSKMFILSSNNELTTQTNNTQPPNEQTDSLDAQIESLISNNNYTNPSYPRMVNSLPSSNTNLQVSSNSLSNETEHQSSNITTTNTTTARTVAEDNITQPTANNAMEKLLAIHKFRKIKMRDMLPSEDSNPLKIITVRKKKSHTANPSKPNLGTPSNKRPFIHPNNRNLLQALMMEKSSNNQSAHSMNPSSNIQPAHNMNQPSNIQSAHNFNPLSNSQPAYNMNQPSNIQSAHNINPLSNIQSVHNMNQSAHNLNASPNIQSKNRNRNLLQALMMEKSSNIQSVHNINSSSNIQSVHNINSSSNILSAHNMIPPSNIQSSYNINSSSNIQATHSMNQSPNMQSLHNMNPSSNIPSTCVIGNQAGFSSNNSSERAISDNNKPKSSINVSTNTESSSIVKNEFDDDEDDDDGEIIKKRWQQAKLKRPAKSSNSSLTNNNNINKGGNTSFIIPDGNSLSVMSKLRPFTKLTPAHNNQIIDNGQIRKIMPNLNFNNNSNRNEKSSSSNDLISSQVKFKNISQEDNNKKYHNIVINGKLLEDNNKGGLQSINGIQYNGNNITRKTDTLESLLRDNTRTRNDNNLFQIYDVPMSSNNASQLRQYAPSVHVVDSSNSQVNQIPKLQGTAFPNVVRMPFSPSTSSSNFIPIRQKQTNITTGTPVIINDNNIGNKIGMITQADATFRMPVNINNETLKVQYMKSLQRDRLFKQYNTFLNDNNRRSTAPPNAVVVQPSGSMERQVNTNNNNHNNITLTNEQKLILNSLRKQNAYPTMMMNHQLLLNANNGNNNTEQNNAMELNDSTQHLSEI